MFDELSDMVTVDEACEALLIGRNRCYKLLSEGELRGFRIGSVWKIPKQAIIDFVKESSAARSKK